MIIIRVVMTKPYLSVIYLLNIFLLFIQVYKLIRHLLASFDFDNTSNQNNKLNISNICTYTTLYTVLMP